MFLWRYRTTPFNISCDFFDSVFIIQHMDGLVNSFEAIRKRFRKSFPETQRQADDVFRRHDNCGCSTIYENGRQRQDVWSKKTWEVKAAPAETAKPMRLTLEQGREIEQRNLRYRGLEAEVSKLKTKNPNTLINSAFIESAEYRRRFDQLGESTQMTRIISQQSRGVLKHRNGTEFEDLVFIDSVTGNVKTRTDYNVPRMVEPSKAMRKMLSDAEPHTIIAIHNHPSSTVPSISDINAARDRKYKYGIIACHDGKLFKYSVIDEYDEMYVNMLLDKLHNVVYNKEKLESSFHTKLNDVLKELSNNGLEMKVIL